MNCKCNLNCNLTEMQQNAKLYTVENALSWTADVRRNTVLPTTLMEILLLGHQQKEASYPPPLLTTHRLSLFLSAGGRLKVSIGFIVSIVQTDIQCKVWQHCHGQGKIHSKQSCKVLVTEMQVRVTKSEINVQFKDLSQ